MYWWLSAVHSKELLLPILPQDSNGQEIEKNY